MERPVNHPNLKSNPQMSPFAWGSVAVCACIALFSRLSFFTDPFKNDAGIYVYLGKVLWTGGRLYQDFWETKLPSVPLLMAPLYALFGAHWIPYVLLQAVLGISAAWLLAVSLRQCVGVWTYFPAIVLGLLALNNTRVTLTGFQLETVQAFFEIIAACFVLHSLKNRTNGLVLLAGFVGGIAAMPKPTGLAVVGAAAAAYLWEVRSLGLGRTFVRLVLLAMSALFVPLLIVTWVLSSSFRQLMPDVLHEIQLYATGTPWRSVTQPKTAIFFAIPLLPILLRMMLAWRSDPLPENAFETRRTARTTLVFGIVWLMLEIAAVVMQRRLYGYHFLVITPPAIVLFALLPRSSKLWPTLVAAAPIAAISIYFSLPGYRPFHLPQPMPASVYIAQHTTKEDFVWGDPEARLLLETGCQAGSRLQMTFYLVNHDDAPRKFTEQLINDFNERKPKFIVIPMYWDQEPGKIAEGTLGLSLRPTRRAAYMQEMRRLLRYVDTMYYYVETIDGKTIMQRKPE